MRKGRKQFPNGAAWQYSVAGGGMQALEAKRMPVQLGWDMMLWRWHEAERTGPFLPN